MQHGVYTIYHAKRAEWGAVSRDQRETLPSGRDCREREGGLAGPQKYAAARFLHNALSLQLCTGHMAKAGDKSS